MSSVFESLTDRVDPIVASTNLVAASPAARRLLREARRLSLMSLPVAIVGESGTGKETLARWMHHHASAGKRSFVAVDLTALGQREAEDLLFGTERGKDRPGLLARSESGTVFLVNVHRASTTVQRRLLRVIEGRADTARTGATDRPTRTRLLFGIESERTTGVISPLDRPGFRRDFALRIAPATIEVPPLRERREDITLLANRFLDEVCARNRMRRPTLSAETARRLQEHTFPGNIRELYAVVEAMVVSSRGQTIGSHDLPDWFYEHRRDDEPTLVQACRPSVSQSEPSSDHEPDRARPLRVRVAEFERRAIVAALKRTRGNQTAAAEDLQIPLRTLVAKIRRYALKRTYAPSETD